jgi:hypothetical protein
MKNYDKNAALHFFTGKGIKLRNVARLGTKPGVKQGDISSLSIRYARSVDTEKYLPLL